MYFFTRQWNYYLAALASHTCAVHLYGAQKEVDHLKNSKHCKSTGGSR